MKLLFLTLLLVCLSCHHSSVPLQAPGEPPAGAESPTESEKEGFSQEIPEGIFEHLGAAKQSASQILDDPRIVGVGVRTRWPAVEALEGKYNWSFLDQEIPRVANKGKKIFLYVVSGGFNTPDWVKAKGVTLFSFTDDNPYRLTFGQVLSIPLFWDPAFLEAKKRLIKEAGKRFSQNKSIVMFKASCANATSDDWFMPSNPVDVENWKRLGYSAEKLIQACQEIIDTAMEAFPNQFIVFSIGRTLMDPDPNFVAREVVKYARQKYGQRFIVTKNGLSATTPDPTKPKELQTLGGKSWEILLENRPYTAAQMLWFVTDDETCRMNKQVTPCDPLTVLREAVEIGFRYEFRFIEIYQVDLLNPDLEGVIDDTFQKFQQKK